MPGWVTQPIVERVSFVTAEESIHHGFHHLFRPRGTGKHLSGILPGHEAGIGRSRRRQRLGDTGDRGGLGGKKTRRRTGRRIGRFVLPARRWRPLDARWNRISLTHVEKCTTVHFPCRHFVLVRPFITTRPKRFSQPPRSTVAIRDRPGERRSDRHWKAGFCRWERPRRLLRAGLPLPLGYRTVRYGDHTNPRRQRGDHRSLRSQPDLRRDLHGAAPRRPRPRLRRQPPRRSRQRHTRDGLRY